MLLMPCIRAAAIAAGFAVRLASATLLLIIYHSLLFAYTLLVGHVITAHFMPLFFTPLRCLRRCLLALHYADIVAAALFQGACQSLRRQMPPASDYCLLHATPCNISLLRPRHCRSRLPLLRQHYLRRGHYFRHVCADYAAGAGTLPLLIMMLCFSAMLLPPDYDARHA